MVPQTQGSMMRFILCAAAICMLAAQPALAQTLDGAAVVGAPPAVDSPRGAADRLAMRPTVSAERLAQARADLAFDPWRAFTPVLGADFTQARLPRTAAVFAAVNAALSAPVNAAKGAYDRARPYAADRTVLQCDDPGPNASTGGSYPSGHGAGGWAWALVLAELLPSRASDVLSRGRDFGESRIICGYHFPSDIDASRLIAAGVVARLHADAGFRRDLDAARRELTRAYPAD